MGFHSSFCFIIRTLLGLVVFAQLLNSEFHKTQWVECVRLLLQPYNIRTTHRYSHTTISALLYCRTAATYISTLTLLHPITRDLRPPFCDYRTSCLHALPPMDALRDSCPWISLPDLWSTHTLLTCTAYHQSFSRVHIPLP